MIATLKNSSPLFFYSAIAFFVVGLLMIVFSFLDSTQISGANRWYKPAKFCFSIGLYLATLIYVFELLPSSSFVRLAKTVILLVMVGEIFCIILQAARGVTSHFNTSTALDGSIFGIMGLLIVVNTVILIALMIAIIGTHSIDLVTKVAFSAALGSLLIASFIGVWMSSIGRHELTPDVVSQTLPFLGWKVQAGDLRIPHFVGLHGLQLIPLFAYAIQQSSIQNKLSLVIIFSIVYYGLTISSIYLPQLLTKANA